MKLSSAVLSALAAALLAAGCSAFRYPTPLPAGTSPDEVRARFGPPTGAYALPGGGQRLEYARGPLGRQTWMYDFDADAHLLGVAQVLTEKRFNEIRLGMTRDELRAALGPPSESGVVGFSHQVVWSYRYDGPFCQWFRVGIDAQGLVEDTGYYIDPACDADDNFFGMFRHR